MATRRKKLVEGVGALFGCDSTWIAPVEPPRLDDVDIMAVDCETHDPNLKILGPGFLRGDAHVVGVALATEDRQWYFPLHHAEGNCTWDATAWLREQLAQNRLYVFANAQYDIEALYCMQACPAGHWIDVLVDQALLDEEFEPGYSLNAVAEHWLGKGKADDILFKHAQHYGTYGPQTIQMAKEAMKDLPAKAVGEYAEIDARRTFDVHRAQEERIILDGLEQVCELERHIIPLAWQMRKNGVRFDRAKAARLRQEWYQQEEELLADINATGYRVDPWSGRSIQSYCDRQGISYSRTPKGNASFSKDFFHKANPVLQLIGQFRSLNKMRRGFIDTWLEHSTSDGRVHARWHQVAAEDGGTRSGRFASTDPNMQQVPARDPRYGPMLRSLFLPEPGELFMKGDYSGQEIRIAIHYAHVLKCTGAQEIVDRYLADKQFDFHNMIVEMSGLERVHAKTLALGSLYGMGPEKSKAQLGFSGEKSQRMYDEYFRIAPYFRELSNIAMNRATRIGYVKTFCGRRRRFKDTAYAHKATNAIVQGTAADMAKQAMINIYEELGLVPLLQVHDELCYSVPSLDVGRELTYLMETALNLSVPMYVEPKFGVHW